MYAYLVAPRPQVNSHQADGMMALYNITGEQPAYPLNGTVRTYYIQAVRPYTMPALVAELAIAPWFRFRNHALRCWTSDVSSYIPSYCDLGCCQRDTSRAPATAPCMCER